MLVQWRSFTPINAIFFSFKLSILHLPNVIIIILLSLVSHLFCFTSLHL